MKNLRASGAIKDFAEKIGVKPGYASGIASPNPEKAKRAIGDNMARRIENAFGMARGWLDSNNLVESKVPKASIGKQELPLLKGDDIYYWIDGTLEIASERIFFPVLPMMELSSLGFAFEETTNSMPPQSPGDFYYVDPKVEAKAGDWVMYWVDGVATVGIYKKARKSGMLEFTDPQEPSVAIKTEDYIGKITTRMNGDFLRSQQ
jgi:hypothetical protein